MKLGSLAAYAGSILFLAGDVASAITLDLNSKESIKKAAGTLAYDMMSYYTGNRTGDTPGNLPDPYYWWECGAMFGTMVNYWYYTGDTTYNAVTQQALLHQAGNDGDFMPLNQTKTLGNDDQGFWGMAAMTAAETGFADPPSPNPGWLALAQGVFNTQAPRWDTTTCGGGFRWQIYTFNSGYTYKNAISNGCFFNLAARLALYTGNATYAEYAVRTWDWVNAVGLMTPEYDVYDGTQNTDNCTSKDHNQWTYNNGIYMLGAAAMFNYTNGTELWKGRTAGLVNATSKFFVDGVMYEPCEDAGKCNVDQRSFKAYLARWLAATGELVPSLNSVTIGLLKTSAQAAVKICTGGTSGTKCGLKWTTGVHDGSIGVGEQMAALEVVQSHLASTVPGWVSAVDGTGTSKGDVNAGSGTSIPKALEVKAATSADRAGAGILTALILLGVLAGSAWLCI